jgi:hypothetical protein
VPREELRVLLFSDMLIFDTKLEGESVAVNVQLVKRIEMKQNFMSKIWPQQFRIRVNAVLTGLLHHYTR